MLDFPVVGADCAGPAAAAKADAARAVVANSDALVLTTLFMYSPFGVVRPKPCADRDIVVYEAVAESRQQAEIGGDGRVLRVLTWPQFPSAEPHVIKPRQSQQIRDQAVPRRATVRGSPRPIAAPN
ncbi:hypothetical protein GCM10022236_21190 [Microlunatus ginsengisoli]|uniref:Uncharacterized protein n=1 Tax=Microlunatus ginsengisoli TaxID=363863 RepID=A0ABP6ZW01_9ACTN